MRRTRNDNAAVIVAMIVASVLLHVVLWPVGNHVLELTFDGSDLPRSERVMEVSLLGPPDEREDEDEEPEPEDPELPEPDLDDKNLVQLDRVPDERPPEVDTDNVSEFDSRVDKETKAPNRRPTPSGLPTPSQRPTPDQSASPSEPLAPGAKSLALGTRPSADSSDAPGHALPDSELAQLERGQSPDAAPTAPTLGRKDLAAAMQGAFGGPGTFDTIDAEEGNENLLNARRTRYASFFNRVRNAVAQHWEPEKVHRAHDPDGRIFGNKTRRTKLIIRLNADGSLAKIQLGGSAYAEHLDEEAIRAVRAAAPFDNPPKGLVDPDTGFIEFGFGFIFEIQGGARIFRYQR